MELRRMLRGSLWLLGLIAPVGVAAAELPVGGVELFLTKRPFEAQLWSSGNDAVLVAGTHFSQANYAARVFRVLPDGSVPTDLYGSVSGEDLKSVPDGVGGAWVPNGYGDVWIGHVTADGSVDPAYPKLVASTASSEQAAHACSDGAGGVFVSWFVIGPYTLRLQHLNAAGAVVSGWPAAGLLIASGFPYIFSQHVLASDGAGGAVVVWLSDLVRARRVSSAGTFVSGWPATGLAIGTLAPESQINPRLKALAPAPSHLQILARCRDGSQTVAELSVVDLSGAVPVVTSPFQVARAESLLSLRLESDGADGALVAFAASPSGLAHVRADGLQDPAWPVGGLVLPASTTIAVSRHVSGVLAVATDDGRTPEQLPVPRVRWFLADGSPDPAAPALGYEVDTHLAWGTGPGGKGGTVAGILAVAPRDARIAWTGADFSFYSNATRLSRSPEADVLGAGPGPATLGHLTLSPNPVCGRLTLRFTIAAQESGTLQLFDLAGRCVWSTTVEGGTHEQTLSLGSSGLLRPGLHFARLVTPTRTLVAKAVVEN